MRAVDAALAAEVVRLVDHGLVSGLGFPEPGQMCVEAAVNFALGLPHGDRPPCVGDAVRRFKIRLNDSAWSSSGARAAGMRRLAVAQLGSDTIDQRVFAELITRGAIQQIVPIALRAAAWGNPIHATTLLAASDQCEREGTGEDARGAQRAACAAAAFGADNAYAAAYAAAAFGADNAYAAAYAADNAAFAAAYAAYAADNAYAAAASAAVFAAASAAVFAAASADVAAAASAAVFAAASADVAAARDYVLGRMAEAGVAALVELQSTGRQWLSLCDASAGS